MAEILTALLTYGPLGIFCAVLWMTVKQKDDQIREIQAESQKQIQIKDEQIQKLMESHSRTLDDIRKAQTEREKEVSVTLQSFGNSIVTAVEQAHDLAERLWGIRK